MGKKEFDYVGLLTEDDRVTLGATRVVPGLDVSAWTAADQAKVDAQEAADQQKALARGWTAADIAARRMPASLMAATDPPKAGASSPASVPYYAPAAGGYMAARSCGANGMTWAHFLALAIFIACLVAVQYGIRQSKQKNAT